VSGSVTDFVRLLYQAIEPPARGVRSLRRVELERVDLLSLLAAASWNINFMLLERFLSELGFRRRQQLQRAHRILADLPVVILVAEFAQQASASSHAFLVYSECGRFRVSAAFLDGAVGFIRGTEVVTYPVTGLRDDLLLHSSAHGLSIRNSSSNLP